MLNFVKILKQKSLWKLQSTNNVNTITLGDGEIVKAKEYFFRKATLEGKKFIKPAQYQKISIERDNILYSGGRIFLTNNIKITDEMSTAMKDFAETHSVYLSYKSIHLWHAV